MAATFAVVKGVLPNTLSGTVDLTSSGFGTVKGAILFSSNANTTNNPEDDLHISIGLWDATNQRSAGAFSNDNISTTSETARQQITDGVLIGLRETTPELYRASCTNITDGIRLTIDVDNTGASRYVTAILIGGSASVNVGTITPNGTSGNTASESGLSYQPDVVFFLGIGESSTTYNVPGIFSWGVAVDDGSATQRAMMLSADDNVSTSRTGSRLETDSIGGQFYNDAITWTAELTAFASNGFTLTTRDGSTSGDTLYYMAINLDGGNAWLGTLTTPTSPGSDSVTATSFTPQLAIVAGHVTTAADSSRPDATFSAGAADVTSERAVAVRDEDNVTTTDASSRMSENLISFLAPTDGTEDVVAALSSFNSDGRTYSYSTVNASARYGWELLLAGAAATTTSGNLLLLGVG